MRAKPLLPVSGRLDVEAALGTTVCGTAAEVSIPPPMPPVASVVTVSVALVELLITLFVIVSVTFVSTCVVEILVMCVFV